MKTSSQIKSVPAVRSSESTVVNRLQPIKTLALKSPPLLPLKNPVAPSLFNLLKKTPLTYSKTFGPLQTRKYCTPTTVFNYEDEVIEPIRTFYDFTVLDQNDQQVSLSDYKGKVILVVNVASKCGYTRQYPQLQKLHNKYVDKGFVVLGFPSNQFGEHEPGTTEEIKQFCATYYNPPITFPIFSKIDCNGETSHPLYKWLRDTVGIKEVEWNFEKYLINQNGQIWKHYLSAVKPDALSRDIEDLLNNVPESNAPAPTPIITVEGSAPLNFINR